MISFKSRHRVRLDGARVLITGASSGIGRALALELARRGSLLVLAARRLLPLQDAADDVTYSSAHGSPSVVKCDVCSEADVENLVETAERLLGGIDILVNNAGSCVYGAAGWTTTDDLRSMLRVHVLGPYTAMRAVIPRMQSRGGGLIVNVASLSGLHGIPYLSGYGAAKAALVALSQSLCAELHGSGVRVLAVCPGYTATSLFSREKNVGGARRPDGPHRPAESVAASIARCIREGRQGMVTTAQGRLLYITQSLWPGLVEHYFDRMADRLREDYSYA
jgi:NAD(P)-dependent dehydrogenase (short-subunit alcohol dehydrogenase family)